DLWQIARDSLPQQVRSLVRVELFSFAVDYNDGGASVCGVIVFPKTEDDTQMTNSAYFRALQISDPMLGDLVTVSVDPIESLEEFFALNRRQCDFRSLFVLLQIDLITRPFTGRSAAEIKD